MKSSGAHTATTSASTKYSIKEMSDKLSDLLSLKNLGDRSGSGSASDS